MNSKDTDLLIDIPKTRWERWKFCVRSLTYNHFMDQNYIADVIMEPMFWFVDNFTSVLGPFFVVAVCFLTLSVIWIAYWIGLPYWWNYSQPMTVVLLIVGNWLLINNLFHYYMAVITPPGYPPEDKFISETVSICKKCISPKPPRTHHCSICKRCILKMDHHCPWLNNCVGHFNHRYFYMYMFYTVVGVLFIIIFGINIGLDALWYSPSDMNFETEPHGHPIRFNKSGAVIRLPELPINDSQVDSEFLMDVEEMEEQSQFTDWERRAILYMALLNIGVFIALGGLLFWHTILIHRGETSIESNINKDMKKQANSKNFINPYDFGPRKNWKLFLGLVRGRSIFWHALLPSPHKPEGDGLTFYTVHDGDEWP